MRRNHLRSMAVGAIAAAAMGAGLAAASHPAPAILSRPPQISRPVEQRKRRKKGPAPKPMNRKHLSANALFMLQIREEREIGTHPKYRHASQRAWSLTAKQWEERQTEWRRANWPKHMLPVKEGRR